MRGGVVTGALGVVLLAVGTASAGEIVLQAGQRIDGELIGEPLRVSTASGPVEVAPDDVVLVAGGELRLKDGRVVVGTLLPGPLRAETAEGEVTIEAGSLESYRAGSWTPPREWTTDGAPTRVPAHGAAAPGSGPAGDLLPALAAYQGSPLPPVPSAAPSQVTLPPVAAFQGNGAVTGAVVGPDPSSAGPTLAVARPDAGSKVTPGPRRVELVGGESALYRDAYSTARQVGRVAPGEPLLLVDAIDRRLRIMNAVVFDGGQWLKVRAADGTEGWLPAASVRDVR